MKLQSPMQALLACALLCAVGIAQAGQVNVNTADAATLAKELKGVGMKHAEAIIEYRKQHGPFKSADELALVKGIGPAAIEKNRDNIRVDARATASVSNAGAAPQRTR
jgi:competence protein ComEA